MKPVVIGSGLAGLMVALSLAPMPVLLVTSGKLGAGSASAWAQGGVAAAMGADDSPTLHAADTDTAGCGLCDAHAVQAVVNNGRNVIERLLSYGVIFDRTSDGALNLGLEAAHSRRRIVHARDATGAAIMDALVKAVRTTPSIEILENTSVSHIMHANNRVAGVVLYRDANSLPLPATQIVLATGGVGALWRHTSNPLSAWGGGLNVASRAGAVMADMEFMQFHPTALDGNREPMPLVSEALRGEGCTLIDDKGERFTDELKPRDIVTREIIAHMQKGHAVFLDARHALGTKFAERFPHIDAVCKEAGINPATQPIPVAPAAHYHMGGIAVDICGRSSVEGLWACGEAACTGLHGANRLASNSLLEAAHFGMVVAEDIQGNQYRGASQFGLLQDMPFYKPNDHHDTDVRNIMTTHVGVTRNAEGLKKALHHLLPLVETNKRAAVGLMIAAAALCREESRGGHFRKDFPQSIPVWQQRQMTTLDQAKAIAKEFA